MNNKPYIICADDIQTHQIAISEMLDSQYDLACINNGLAFIESIIDRIPDLILLGDKMPLSTDYDTCKLLRENDQYRDIPIISLCENGSGQSGDDQGKHRCDLYLELPIEKDQLIASINQLLN